MKIKMFDETLYKSSTTFLKFSLLDLAGFRVILERVCACINVGYLEELLL